MRHFSEGFHGTSAWRAHDIERNGFNTDGKPLWLATPHNIEVAHEFGQDKVSQDARRELDVSAGYAILHVAFPLTEIDPSMGFPRIRIAPEYVGRVMIRSITEYLMPHKSLLLSQSPKVGEQPTVPSQDIDYTQFLMGRRGPDDPFEVPDIQY